MRILGIESSADDSGVALIEAEGNFGPDFRFTVLGNEVASQRHAEYGGIYPNVAKQEHIKNLPLLLEKVQKEHPEKPDVIAVTHGPGLEPCLWAGINFAQKLAKDGPPAGGVPVVGVNHLEGHIVMSMMQLDAYPDTLPFGKVSGCLHANVEFPMIALLVSGGNTQLVLSKEPFHYEVLGKTRDDAAGEAFDKVGRMLGLAYPSGPEISRLAEIARKSDEMSSHRYRLPRPMLREENLDFSFSGLKTAVLRIVEKEKPLSEEIKLEIARELEEAIAEVLVGKTLRAVEEYGANIVVTGGGVAANTFIRAELADALEEVGCRLLVCPPALSTDNALMIALAGYFHALKNEFTEPDKLTANGDLTLS